MYGICKEKCSSIKRDRCAIYNINRDSIYIMLFSRLKVIRYLFFRSLCACVFSVVLNIITH